MKQSAIIQARMGSSRLPGKVLKLIDDKPLLFHVINQLKNCKQLKNIIVATTNLPEDDIIEEYVKKLNISYFRGHPTDVLDRFFQCAKFYSIKIIIRITADNPLIDPNIVDNAIEKFNNGNFDYLSTHQSKTFPNGTETEVFSFQVLEKAWLNAKKPSEREHVTSYFYNNSELFYLGQLTNSENLFHLRYTVDKENDLELVRILFSKIKKRPILISDIIKVIKNEPKLKKINSNNEYNEAYLKSLLDDEKISSN